MGDKIWHVDDARFVALWNAAGSVDEAVAGVRAVVGAPAPRWAVLARVMELRRAGVAVKRMAPVPVAG